MNQRLFAILLLTLTSTSFGQFTYAPINVPGAAATEARGINNNGEIVGFYKTAACADYDIKVPNCPTKGFKYVNGTYIKLMVPGSVTTAIMGVNDYGDLVGFYSKMVSGCSNPVFHGFIWYHQNVVKTIDYPGSDVCNTYPNNVSGTTVPFGINKAGAVVGGLWGVTPTGTFPNGGWVWVNGTFSNMNPVPPNPASPCCWSVTGISNNGILTGITFEADFWQAWLKEATDRDFYMDFPTGNNGADSFGTGINSATDVIGYTSLTGWFAKNIEQNEGTNDSTEVAPSFLVVNYPNSQFTVPFGLNELRGIVGAYADSSGKQHGFLAK
jgi:hypothetical protein